MTPCVVCSKKRDEKRDDQSGLVCFRCSGRILRYLRELEEWLPVLPRTKPAPGISAYQRPVFGSRSPANDAAIAHTDPRSEPIAWDENNRAWRSCGCYVGECEHSPDLGAVNVIGSWARLVSEDRGINVEPYWMQQADLLRRNHSWIVQQLWVGEYAAQLKKVHASVRRLAGDPVPQSVGYCIRFENNVECKAEVFELDDASGVRCSKNKAHTYYGLDLERFRVAQEAG